MNWKNLRHLVSRTTDSAQQKTVAVQFPVEHELVPGELKAIVHSHSVNTFDASIPCWSYVSEGLARHSPREVIFTLAVLPGEDLGSYSHEPLAFFRMLLDLSKHGRTVGTGDITRS